MWCDATAMAFNAIQTQRCVNLVKRNQTGSKTAVSAVLNQYMKNIK